MEQADDTAAAVAQWEAYVQPESVADAVLRRASAEGFAITVIDQAHLRVQNLDPALAGLIAPSGTLTHLLTKHRAEIVAALTE